MMMMMNSRSALKLIAQVLRNNDNSVIVCDSIRDIVAASGEDSQYTYDALTPVEEVK